ncbi:endonuclease/exonuclease/phosphatase family protein [Streptomyces pseudovenezuelae]|uniref:Endonuclease/exonuclease/phosphatase family metal-dependent hydrolase n=1 Tax=Streptomyces pseudovenezuelae TaxID=67350 RepID=A0ABT6LTQ1_9ACTN|nr:endonuclease/exonuclease/phosphatase family protein [Streptomyces pseudovenezuelae]MDH6219169.1 endonuclease/exonuclease/phosphatase family metal-dependent hydrolase [Streptomyces pseudovenezuelae]
MPSSRRVTRRLGLKAVLAAAVTVPLSSAAIPPSSASSTSSAPSTSARAGRVRRAPLLDVMTFNLRFAGTAEPNSWHDRRPVMRELLRSARPQIIGTQEGLYQQLRDIDADLGPDYDWIGTGREGGSRDESTAIYYDLRRLVPVEHYTFWLSDTPEVIRSKTWGAAFPRIVTWVRFSDLADDGREFYVLNTHFDHVSQYARERSATLMTQRIAEFDRTLPVVVTGDFNVAAHKNPAYDTLVGSGLVDTWNAAEQRSALYGTFHSYREPAPNGDRIDWILTSPGVRTNRATINTFSLNGQFPSDHLPVQASLTLG